MVKVIIILLTLIFFVPSFASTTQTHTPSEKMPPIQKTKNTNPWSIGAGVIFSSNPYKDTKQSFAVWPLASYTGNNISIIGPNVSYLFLGKPYLGLRLQASLFSESFDPKDSSDPQLQKLNKRGYSILSGISGTMMFNQHMGVSLALNRSFWHVDGGILADAQYFLFVPLKNADWSAYFLPGVGVHYQSEKLTNYYFGISASESQGSLSAYSPKSAYLPYLSIMFQATYKNHYEVYLIAHLERLPNTIYNSPMISTRTNLYGSIGILYKF